MKDNDIYFPPSHSLIRQVVIFLKISSTQVLPKRREKKKNIYSKGGRRREKKTKNVFSWLNFFFSFFKKMDLGASSSVSLSFFETLQDGAEESSCTVDSGFQLRHFSSINYIPSFLRQYLIATF